MPTLGSSIPTWTHHVPRRLRTWMWHFSPPKAHAFLPRTMASRWVRSRQPYLSWLCLYLQGNPKSNKAKEKEEGDDGGDGGRNSQVTRKRETKTE
ncbi:hypothetical protein D8674_042371 [Pyrus ussuriensis x Pyrus communis]|uniref:Uncharacterized protein n=1 Tax=Pyrus ussuriensis x Pyrus communis TaxID=2448454 RepID=A0A5N5GHT2_9ROSA|nr:hypothetical protein D8674_042371 [Pyrus ussuriensis x Pyrus communis]